MISKTVSHIHDHTAVENNERIRRQTEENIALLGIAGQKTLEQRLAELDYEWGIERTLEA